MDSPITSSTRVSTQFDYSILKAGINNGLPEISKLATKTWNDRPTRLIQLFCFVFKLRPPTENSIPTQTAIQALQQALQQTLWQALQQTQHQAQQSL